MRLKNITYLAALAIMFAAFLWAYDGVVLTPWVTSLGMQDVPTFVFMLHATASVFLTYFLVKKRGELKNISRTDWLAFILVGLFGGAIGTMAIIGAIIGVLALIAAFSFGSSTVFSKKAVTKISHGLGTALRFFLTTFIMIIIIAVIAAIKTLGVETTYAGLSGFSVLTWKMLLAFVIIALTTGGTAIFIYYWGLKRVTATRSTIYELMFPVAAIILEYFVHDKLLNTGQWFGAALVIGSILAIVNLKTQPNNQKLSSDLVSNS